MQGLNYMDKSKVNSDLTQFNEGSVRRKVVQILMVNIGTHPSLRTERVHSHAEH